MTVKVLKCGISSFPFDATSASGAIPNDQPAQASSGNQFCRATVTIKNVGDNPMPDGVSQEETTLTANSKTYAVDPLSSAILYTLNDQAAHRGVNTGYFAGDLLNPGATATQSLVWQIPASASVDSVDFTSPPTKVQTH